MKIYVGDELLEFSDEELKCMYVDYGKEAMFFKYVIQEVLKLIKKKILIFSMD